MKKSDRMRRAREMAAELGEHARERVEEVVEAAREKAEEAFEHAYEAAEGGVDDARVYLRRQWRDHPLTTAGVAVGIGVIIGLALRSGYRD